MGLDFEDPSLFQSSVTSAIFLHIIHPNLFILILPSDPMAEPGCEVVEDHLRSVFCDLAEILAKIFRDLHIAATRKKKLFLSGSPIQYKIIFKQTDMWKIIETYVRIGLLIFGYYLSLKCAVGPSGR
jgi:hypothetical protein